MKIGIVGLPNVGKSTIFNALTNAGAESANYPFCTIESNVGVVAVPDERLDKLGELYKTKKIVPTTIEFVDIAGLVKGASQGEGLGNKFLSHIREVDAILHVLRCFNNDDIAHVSGTVNPVDDLETVNLELILADLEILERRLEKTKKLARNVKEERKNLEILEKLVSELQAGRFPDLKNYSKDELEFIKSLQLITTKPVLYVANVGEDDLGEDNEYVVNLKEYVKDPNKVLKISAQIEQELSQLDEEEMALFLQDMGIDDSGLKRVIKSSYDLLGLMSFLTAGPDECRAWTIKKGTKAPEAAGKVHSDMQKGFIRAEVTNYEDLLKYGSEAKTKELGLTRIEGKDYVMQDNDVVLFRFNV